MQLDELVWNCPNCASWYTDKTAPYSTLEMEEGRCTATEMYYCDCLGDRVLLLNAHEYNMMTPYDELRAEVLKSQILNVRRHLNELEQMLRHHQKE